MSFFIKGNIIGLGVGTQHDDFQGRREFMKIRKTVIYILCVLLLTGCASTEETEKVWEEKVSVVSGGETYLPVKNFVFSEATETDSQGKEQTVCACGAWLRPDKIKFMPRVPWNADMGFHVDEEPDSFSCVFYDSTYEKMEGKEQDAESLDALVFPKPQDTYYVEAVITFSYPGGTRGDQYFFQVVPDESTPELSASMEADGKGKIPCGKGRGSFPTMTKNKLPYVPIGSRLYLSFSGDDIPDTIHALDFVLRGGEELPEFWEGDVPACDILPEDEYSIFVGTNLNAMKFGYPEAYQPGGIIRGLLLECTFPDGREETYAIAFKTDIAFGIEKKPSPAYLTPLCGTGVRAFGHSYPEKKNAGFLLTFELENSGLGDLVYEDWGRLYRFDGPEIKEIPPLSGQDAERKSRTLKSGKSKRLKFDLENLYGSLGPGYYRFQMELTDPKNGGSYGVPGDFVINCD